MALLAVGIDAEVCDQLDAVLEKGGPPGARVQILNALSRVRPPSPRTLKAVTACLNDPTSYVQHQAAQALGGFAISTPEIVSALQNLQLSSSNHLVVICASAALWDLQQDPNLVLPHVFPILEQAVTNFVPSPFPGSGGQGVSESEQVAMMSGFLFQRMTLSEAHRVQALDLLNAYGRKSGRIFIRMLLLPPLVELGLPSDACLAVCRDGLNAPEDYYRIQAARLLVELAGKRSVEGIDFDVLLQDRDVNVRIYAAKAHWGRNHQAQAVVPVLAEALDRSRHQSYYYAETLPVALAVLEEIGPAAKDATRPLESLLNDPNPTVGGAASNALAKIRN